MNKIGLNETITALRKELAAAALLAENADIQFPVGEVEIEFHVGVTKSSGGSAGVNFWVIELDAEGSYASETVQKVIVKLQAPVDKTGAPVKVSRSLPQKP
jgi:hypothetical protein